MNKKVQQDDSTEIIEIHEEIIYECHKEMESNKWAVLRIIQSKWLPKWVSDIFHQKNIDTTSWTSGPNI